MGVCDGRPVLVGALVKVEPRLVVFISAWAFATAGVHGARARHHCVGVCNIMLGLFVILARVAERRPIEFISAWAFATAGQCSFHASEHEVWSHDNIP